MKKLSFLVVAPFVGVGVVVGAVACSSDPDSSKDAASSDVVASDTTMQMDASKDSTASDGSMTTDVANDAPLDAGVCKPPACYTCCDGQIPNAKDSFRAVLSNCMPSKCATECATELMSQPPYPPPASGSACEKCVFGLVDAGSSCVKQMKTDCGSQMSCVNFVTCMDDCVHR